MIIYYDDFATRESVLLQISQNLTTQLAIDRFFGLNGERLVNEFVLSRLSCAIGTL